MGASHSGHKHDASEGSETLNVGDYAVCIKPIKECGKIIFRDGERVKVEKLFIEGVASIIGKKYKSCACFVKDLKKEQS